MLPQVSVTSATHLTIMHTMKWKTNTLRDNSDENFKKYQNAVTFADCCVDEQQSMQEE